MSKKENSEECNCRKGQLHNAVRLLAEEVKTKGKRTTLNELFGEEDEEHK
ncbi:hypothetical protein P8825_15085 [Shouchella clausii]|nr:hypothetical protein [Shouchella clausii]MEB5480888.1 hypothetical protein [Shouchella clausii]